MNADKRELLISGGIDVDAMLDRCMGNENLLERLLKKFLADRSYYSLVEALQHGDENAAADASHTLKGVSANLGMKKLTAACDGLIKSGRQGGLDKNCYQEVGVQYRKICDSVAEL